MVSYYAFYTFHLIKPEDYYIPAYKDDFFNAATLYRYTIIFNQSSINGHLSWFQSVDLTKL